MAGRLSHIEKKPETNYCVMEDYLDFMTWESMVSLKIDLLENIQPIYVGTLIQCGLLYNSKLLIT